MTKNRMEAFSDGVLAIIITIMVLEMKVQHGTTLAALRPLVPVFLSYVLSFVYVAIYWNNHHHMLHLTQRVNGKILWANMHLLFWLSLIPFVTGWMGENHFAKVPTALYGAALLMPAVAYLMLQKAIIHDQGANSLLHRAIRNYNKETASMVLYVAGIGLAFVAPWMAGCLYAAVAVLWIVPDLRIERTLLEKEAARASHHDA